MRLRFTFLFIAFYAWSFSASAQENDDTKTEGAVIHVIAALPEVKKLPRTFKDTSKHFEIEIKSTPEMELEMHGDSLSIPGKSFNYYLVCAGYRFSNEDYFLAEYTFSVNPENYEVKYQDIVTQKLIPLAEWRARNKRIKNKPNK